MRVTGGTGRGWRLKTLAGSRVRPTSDKVKQALFNILGARIEGAAFLDLFAGAGGIGIEALSRGAERVVFVDASRDSLNIVKGNIDLTGFGDRARTVLSKAESFLKTASEHYDIVFLDPPYADDMRPLLEQVSEAGILNPDSIVIAEHFKKQLSPENAGRLSLVRASRYGDTVLAFYAVKEAP
ncbi:MAG TPA: 16S rRNA (guanine(966)-N(2))-methyltransferase RsmD [Nitrospirota bacterium]